MKPRKERIDVLLVERGLAESRAKAQALVLAGQVVVGDQRVDKPGAQVPVEADIRLKGEVLPYVSRGGLKLKAALEGAPLPPDLEINGQFDDDAAAFELERSLGDGSIGLYEALAIDPAEDVDIEETLSREPINELLQVEDIDGHAAFARLCPHRAAELKLA